MTTVISPAGTKRTQVNYNIWRLVIVNHPKFLHALDEAIERQKRDPDLQVEGVGRKNIWLPLKREQNYKESTKQEFRSLLLKIVYCLIDEKDLENFGWYSVDRELDSLITARVLMDTEEFIERLLQFGGINKKRMQATINFYTRTLKLPEYRIPNGVELPNDRERRKRLAKNKTIDLKDDLIDPVRRFIETDIQYKNYYNDQAVVRGAIAFNIIRGTGMRITNAYQIKLEDLRKVLELGEHKVHDLVTKHSKVNFCYVKCIDRRALKVAISMYEKVPVDALNKISAKSPTRFHDVKALFDRVHSGDRKYTSNMIRNFVADSMLNRGIGMGRTSRMMNHASVSATRHYVNKFHPGPSLIRDDDSDCGIDEESVVNDV
ncbi:vlf-1 [Clostera anastomosis granulovirus A]|uniref:Vlf-1 n=1 Tax=Clostera anastomosis granulovirus A TaxID=1986289 RepID=U5KB67_9BBAC|nr:vlf-1 [Clostera anastomosis granulovirus Henan]AGQ20351.1 vlf-1 [Clostera anastomosis granulovirus Henan]